MSTVSSYACDVLALVLYAHQMHDIAALKLGSRQEMYISGDRAENLFL